MLFQKAPLTPTQQEEVRLLLNHLYRTHHYKEVFRERQAMYYNSRIFAYSHNLHACSNRTRMEGFDFVCNEKGQGNKTMLIIGDQSATDLLHGVKFHFRQIYSELTVVASNSCFLECKEIRSVVEEWPGGIDIVVLAYE